MKAVRALFIVLFNVAVVAPLAASPRVPVAAWPGVSDVLLNVTVSAPAAAWPGPNDSERPGSVLVFPKFRPGLFRTVPPLPRNTFEISVTCPKDDFACLGVGTVTLKAHWVCEGNASNVCNEADFHLTTTVNGTVIFDPVNSTSSSGDFVASPPPDCDHGYLIVWVVSDAISDTPIKLDALTGHSHHREAHGDWAYNAIPIQASENLFTLDPTDVDGDLALDFDGSEYQPLTGTVFGSVRYQGTPSLGAPRQETTLIFLTLDAVSNEVNTPTTVDLKFYNEHEQLVSASTSFVCWGDVRSITDINPSLTAEMNVALGIEPFGTAGLMKSVAATQATPDGPRSVTLIGLVEIVERVPIPADGVLSAKHAYVLFNDGEPVPTTFYP